MAITVFAVMSLMACASERQVPEKPTWADVEPIFRAECLHCHGGNAQIAGSGSGAVYRFDFFDMSEDTCGEAAEALSASSSAAALAPLIANSITSVRATTRPRMPPAPASSLEAWEWQTILRWTAAPEKGPPPLSNHAPLVRLTESATTADKTLHISAVLEDPDGESAIGLLKVGDLKLKMERPGVFAGDIDTSQWDEGEVAVSAVVCDGWGAATYQLGSVAIFH